MRSFTRPVSRENMHGVEGGSCRIRHEEYKSRMQQVMAWMAQFVERP